VGFFIKSFKQPKLKDVDQVKVGMTEEEVMQIMPEQMPGIEAERRYQDGDKTVLMWQLADGPTSHSRNRTVEIAFRENKVVYSKIS